MTDPSGPPQHSVAPKRGRPVWLILLICLPVLVLVVLPVFSVLAIYGVRKYIANAKTAEARSTLAEIARDAAATYDPQRGFCPSAPHPVPADRTGLSGQKYQSAPSDWDDGRAPSVGFACLKFSLQVPQYYQYSYKTTGVGRTAFEATAHGDLNGDGNFSTFIVRGAVGPGGVVAIAPRIEEDHPEE
jgi:type IV pilus assembly protein PilA